jgi:hypothetical protein
VLASVTDPDMARQGLATVIMQDVHRGMTGVAPGTIKYLRVNEQVPRSWAARRDWDGDCYDYQHAVIAKDAHLGLKVQHGIVPVAADGSAHFTVPADRNIFLQALDENFMEVQRERTYVNYRPGETRTCIGCHELPNEPPVAEAVVPLVLRRPPDKPGPQPGEKSGARPIHYATDVQPVLDQYCVRCHSGSQPRGNLDLGGEMTALFNRSYENLLARQLLPIIGETHPKTGNVDYLPPFSLGSHASRLVAVVRNGCPGNAEKLPLEALVRLTTWVDSNGQYYGSYYGRRNLKYQGLPDFRPVLTFAEAVSQTAPLLVARRP